jgi:hypothetical protein
MAADQQPQPAPIAPPRLRLRWLSVVVAVMVLLTGGWPLANSLVADRHRLATGSTLRIGPSAADSARFTVGPGWLQVPSQTNPFMSYALRRGSLQVSVLFVALVNTSQTPELWTGLRKLVQAANPGARLGSPVTVVTAAGNRGLIGTLNAGSMTGLASEFPSPSKGFAIEMVALGPRTTRLLNLRATRLLMRSLRFPPASR